MVHPERMFSRNRGSETKTAAFAKQLVWEVDIIHRMIETKSNHMRSRKQKCEWKRNYADLRLRVKGRFLKKVDEEFLRECANLA